MNGYADGTADLVRPESRLVIARPDGRNAQVHRSTKGKLMTRGFWR